MTNESKLTPDGGSSGETIETLPASRSSSEDSTQRPGSPNISDMSDITAEARSPKDSRLTQILRDAPNASRIIQALGAKLGSLVEWRRLTLGDGREVFALCFPLDKWDQDPKTRELILKEDVSK